MDLSISVELVDPAIALTYLATTKKNRPLEWERVAQYVELMRSGGWNDLSRYIEFTEEGDLINGQHRLIAIAISGIPQKLAIVRGLPVTCR